MPSDPTAATIRGEEERNGSGSLCGYDFVGGLLGFDLEDRSEARMDDAVVNEGGLRSRMVASSTTGLHILGRASM